MRKNLFAVSMLAVAVVVAPACASKKFVRAEVGNVNEKVDTLSGTVEETQERTRRNEERIGQVDQKAEAAAQSAQAAAQSAQAAGQTAQAAGKSATDARSAADGALARANTVGTEVNSRVDTVEAASRRLVFEVTLSEDQGNFTFGQSQLPDAAKAALDSVITDLKGDPKGNMFIEIEGHTDNVGTKDYNQKLGLERAESVKRYLYEQHQIPLHKMNVISYGEDKPVVPNTNREGRAQTRRVVLKVLL
jgi:outer membrane protein OmpA-like peptidoglycan-associated protein